VNFVQNFSVKNILKTLRRFAA